MGIAALLIAINRSQLQDISLGITRYPLAFDFDRRAVHVLLELIRCFEIIKPMSLKSAIGVIAAAGCFGVVPKDWNNVRQCICIQH